MQPTAKWNEELPLSKPRPAPPPRRYSIAVDKADPFDVVVRQSVAKPEPRTLKIKRHFEIRGDSKMTEEEREEAIADGRQSAFGTPVPAFPSGLVARRETIVPSIQPNRVNRFPSGRLRPRPRPFGRRLTLQAIAATNPAAYRALAIHPEAHVSGVILGYDGNVYVECDMGWGMPKFIKKGAKALKKGVKKVGRVAKKGVKATGRGLKAGAKGAGRGIKLSAKFTARTAKKGIKAATKLVRMTAKRIGDTVPFVKAIAKFSKKLAGSLMSMAKKIAKLYGKALLEVIRLIASTAATPVRFAFQRAVGRKLAIRNAQKNNRSKPNKQDKRLAVKQGFALIKKKMGGFLGGLTIKILKFTRGVSLAGEARTVQRLQSTSIGAALVDDILAWSVAISAALAAIGGTIKIVMMLKKGKPVEAAEAALDTAAKFKQAEQAYNQANNPQQRQFAQNAMQTDARIAQQQAGQAATQYTMQPMPQGPMPQNGQSANIPGTPQWLVQANQYANLYRNVRNTMQPPQGPPPGQMPPGAPMPGHMPPGAQYPNYQAYGGASAYQTPPQGPYYPAQQQPPMPPQQGYPTYGQYAPSAYDTEYSTAQPTAYNTSYDTEASFEANANVDFSVNGEKPQTSMMGKPRLGGFGMGLSLLSFGGA